MDREKQLHQFRKISTDIFSLLRVKVGPHGQFVNFFVEKILVSVDVNYFGLFVAGSN